MKVRFLACCLLVMPLLTSPSARAAEPGKDAKGELARKAQEVLRANCYRCHGQEGSLEGGMNYILDLDKLVQRKKVLPGNADGSPLIKKIVNNLMPPPDEKPRPGEADLATLKAWIEAGAPRLPSPSASRTAILETDVLAFMLADLEKVEPRSRRFIRYFSLAHLYNAGLGEDELQTYRNALSKLLNSLSWHARIWRPEAIDPARTVLRIDLRNFVWDAILWNRVLAEYPYGIFHDTAAARAVSVSTATRMPVVRADWFIATASRAPLYYDLLQMPTNIAELERQLRVDVPVDIQQERVARAGFNGSGVSRNNRLLERHDAIHGAYWKTYDFDGIPQNLIDRQNLLPDRRNLFAYPLGPVGVTANTGLDSFQHAGGEVIFNLPNGLQAYVLINANGLRLDKAPIAIVSDPKRPDRSVEAGVSCMSCHYRGILPKADQMRDYVEKNPRAFGRADAELIKALYIPEAKMKALMDADAERFRKAVETAGARVSPYETVMTMTLRYEADLDLPTVAGELGLTPAEFLDRLGRSEPLARNFGSLKVEGGTVQRQVVIQAFGDMVKELRLGTLFQSTQIGQSLPDNTGEIDPLEARAGQANSMVFTADGRSALFGSSDKTVRQYDLDAAREIRRFVGHTGSVWSVALAPDGKRVFSGSADNTLRVWDVEASREIRRLEGHTALITGIAISPDGKRGLSSSYDGTLLWWDMENLKELSSTPAPLKYINTVAMAPDGRHALLGGEKALVLWDARTGKEVGRFEGHTDAVLAAVFSADGKYVLSGGDDRIVRLWDAVERKLIRAFSGHEASVKSVAFSPDGKQLLSGSTDRTVRLWETATGKELGRFGKHNEPVLSVAFTPSGRQTLSGSLDGAIKVWDLGKILGAYVAPENPGSTETPAPANRELRPAAVIPVGGTIGNLLISPNGKWAYTFNVSESKIGRLDLAGLKRDRELRVPENTETLILSPNGKTLYALVPGRNKETGKRLREGSIQIIDPVKLEVQKTLTLAVDPYDGTATDDGILYLSGGSGDWTDIAAVDVKQETIVARWGGIWNRSLVRLSPAQDRLLISSQGVSPGTLETLLLPARWEDKPTQYRAPASNDTPLGGDFVISPDGKFLLCKTGSVLRLSNKREEDMQPVATLPAFLAAAVDPEAKTAFLLTGDGLLKQYSYPDFKPRGTHRTGLVAYQALLDARAGRLYVAGFQPQALGERPRGRGLGDVFVFDVKGLLGK